MKTAEQMNKFERDLVMVINRHDFEGELGNIPDHIIARHIIHSLEALRITTTARDTWYDVWLEPAGKSHFGRDSEGG